jgi:hypothetical protein
LKNDVNVPCKKRFRGVPYNGIGLAFTYTLLAAQHMLNMDGLKGQSFPIGECGDSEVYRYRLKEQSNVRRRR